MLSTMTRQQPAMKHAWMCRGVLERSEPVPFRLTRNLQTFFTPFGVEGVFITAMAVAAQVRSCLRTPSSSVQTHACRNRLPARRLLPHLLPVYPYMLLCPCRLADCLLFSHIDHLLANHSHWHAHAGPAVAGNVGLSFACQCCVLSLVLV